MKNLLKTLLLIINLAAAVALIVSGYGGHVSPLLSAIPGFALMLLPFFIVSVVVLLVIDLIFWRRLTFLPALALLMCASPVWNLCPLNIAHPEVRPGHRQLKLLTYNVCNFYYNETSVDGDHNYILETILDTDADIVCIQEYKPGDISTWSRFSLQVDSIVDRYPYRSIFYTKDKCPLAVWSRFPLTSFDLDQPSSSSAYFQGIEVMVDSVPLTLYNIHLQSIGLSPDDKKLYGSLTRRITSSKLEHARTGMLAKLSAAMKERATQSIMLRQQIDSVGGSNIIVAGDFNDISDCWSQRTIMGDNLHSAFTSTAVGPTVTYYANRFYFNIDHVLYNNTMQAIKYERLPSRASDHFPVLVTFSYPTR